VIEILFPLEPLRASITRAGQPGHVLEVWFARLLRDAFALTAAGGYRPFPDVAVSALAAVTRNALTDDEVQQIVAGFRELDPHPDAEPALRATRDAGLRPPRRPLPRNLRPRRCDRRGPGQYRRRPPPASGNVTCGASARHGLWPGPLPAPGLLVPLPLT
jgi:hypothetical protein